DCCEVESLNGEVSRPRAHGAQKFLVWLSCLHWNQKDRAEHTQFLALWVRPSVRYQWITRSLASTPTNTDNPTRIGSASLRWSYVRGQSQLFFNTWRTYDGAKASEQ